MPELRSRTNWKQRMWRWLVRRAARPRPGLPSHVPSWENIHRICVLKLDAIGDFVLSTAFLRPLFARIPDERVILIVRKPNGALARQQFPGWRVVELPARDKAWRNVFRQSAAKRILRDLPLADLLVDLRAYRDYSDTVVASWVPAKTKVALANAYPLAWSQVIFSQENQVYDRLFPAESPLPGEAQDLANHRVMGRELLGGETFSQSARPSLIVPAGDAEAVAAMLREQAGLTPGAPYAIIAPGTSHEIKEYPPPRLAAALRAAFGDHPPRLIVAGSAADRRTAVPLLRELGGWGEAFDATGLFSLPQHVALIGGARMAVTMDSSHVHFAGALGVPCVAVLGGGQFGEFGPWGESETFRWLFHRLPCYGCQWHCIYDRPRCIDDIPVEHVAEAIRSVRVKAGF